MGITTIVEFLGKKGYQIDSNPNTKVEPELYDLLLEEYSSDLSVKKESEKLTLKNLRERQESISLEDVTGPAEQEDTQELLITDHTSGSADAVEQQVEKPEPVVQKKKEPVATRKTTESAQSGDAEISEEKIPGTEAEEKKSAKTPGKEAEPEMEDAGPKVVGKIDLDTMNQKTRPSKKGKGEKIESKKEESKQG